MNVGITVSFMNHSAVFVTDALYEAGLCRDVEVSRLTHGDFTDMAPAFFAARNFGLNNVSCFETEKDLALCGLPSWETEFVHKLNLPVTVSGRLDFEWFQ